MSLIEQKTRRMIALLLMGKTVALAALWGSFIHFSPYAPSVVHLAVALPVGFLLTPVAIFAGRPLFRQHYQQRHLYCQ